MSRESFITTERIMTSRADLEPPLNIIIIRSYPNWNCINHFWLYFLFGKRRPTFDGGFTKWKFLFFYFFFLLYAVIKIHDNRASSHWRRVIESTQNCLSFFTLCASILIIIFLLTFAIFLSFSMLISWRVNRLRECFFHDYTHFSFLLCPFIDIFAPFYYHTLY